MRISLKSAATLFSAVLLLSWVGVVQASPRVYVHDVVRSKQLTGAQLLSKKFENVTLATLRDSAVLKVRTLGEGQDQNSIGAATSSQLLSGLVSGKDSFARKKYEDASKVIAAAVKTYEKAPGANDTFTDYLEALEYLGASFQMLDYGGDAKDVYRQRAALSPESDMRRDFGKKVRKRFKKIRKKWLKKKKGTLKIGSAREGLQVQINGLSPTPSLSIGSVELPRGRHRVGCGTTKADMKFTWVKIKSKKTHTVDCNDLVGEPNAEPDTERLMLRFVSQIKRSPNGSDTIADGRDIAKQAGFDYIVIPFMRPQGSKLEVIGVMFSARGGLTVQIGSYGFGRDLPSVAAQAAVFAKSIEGSVGTFPYQNALVPGFLKKPSSRLTDAPLSPRASKMLGRTEPSKARRKW